MATARKTRLSTSTSNIDYKENGIKASNKLRSTKSRASKVHKVFCSCRKPDDGSPMIHCSECLDWYHFRCLQLTERDAEDIQAYICTSCHEKTGLRTVKEWEGPDALEESRYDQPQVTEPDVPDEPSVLEKEAEEPAPSASELTDNGSEDEYVADQPISKLRKTRRLSVSSDSGSEGARDAKARDSKRLRRTNSVSQDVSAHRASGSPGPSQLKRRQSTVTQPPPKRKRSESSAGENAARRFCLTKLEEMFCQIFLRYPYLHDEPPKEAGDDIVFDKKQEELTDEEKERVESKARQFAADLELSMFEIYSEPDKIGKLSAGGKYKERFRMLTFNLREYDRAALHKRIVTSRVTPKELSTMSSTDLASEEAKLSIMQAEQEALAHSILKKTILPRAKITHKGLQDIEDVTGGQREQEREREDEEQERIERERVARLRVQTRRSQSMSVPPESPVASQTPSWGAPPPVPMHAMHTGEAAVATAPPTRPSLHPLFVPTPSELATSAEHELNLDDLINIDDDPSQDGTITFREPAPKQATPPDPAEEGKHSPEGTPSGTPPAQATGISPFAAKTAKPDSSSRPSFDLSSLWSPVPDLAPDIQVDEKSEEPKVDEEPQKQTLPDAAFLGEEADDQDFDMFLEKDEDDKNTTAVADNSPEAQREAFSALPVVWSGTLSMPLDSTIPQEFFVNARQSGGRRLGDDSPLWQTLFPSRQLRIDGRVPVDNSASYLTQSRLNSSKELIAAVFTPDPSTNGSGFQALMNYLNAKGRHGLVFPWGNRQKESSPGRELYIIPLYARDSIPEYMELLDDLRIPKIRDVDYLVGIWVLNKGKLAPPPTPVSQAVPPLVAPPVVPTTPTIDLSQLQQLTKVLSPPNPPIAPPVSLPPAVPSTSALVAEVASLTPEQIQLMLRTLSAGVVQPLPPPPTPQAHAPPMPLPAWTTNPIPSFPPVFPPQLQQMYPSQSPPQQRRYPDAPFDNREFDRGRQPYPSSAYDRGADRGFRGRGGSGNPRGGRGRGGRGDSGWPKQRGGRGGGRGGFASPSRDRGGRWDGSPQRQWT